MQRAHLDAVLGVYEVLGFDLASARLAGPLRAQLEAAGTPVANHDLLIASFALDHDLAVVTRNTREFARVPGLRVEKGYD